MESQPELFNTSGKIEFPQEEVPQDVFSAMKILSGQTDEDGGASLFGSDKGKIVPGAFKERSKKEMDFVISDMEVRAFDLRNRAECDEYSKMLSRVMPLCMSKPEEYRFMETPPQILPSGNNCQLIVLIKFWKQKAIPRIVTPKYDTIPSNSPLAESNIIKKNENQ